MVIGRDAALATVLLAAAIVPVTGDAAPSLTASAQASARPRECSPRASDLRAGSARANVWETARDPNLARYCDLIARALGQLKSVPARARETAEVAEQISPGHAGTALIRGRALAGLGSYEAALLEMDRARQIDPRSLEDPETMRDWAACLARTGRTKEALDAYRALAPRVALIQGADAQAAALLEAADLSFAFGPPALDDAIAFLREARRVGATGLGARIVAELALALDRRAMTEEAASTAMDARRRIGHDADTVAGKQPGAEAAAAVALVLEATDRARAMHGWETYLQAEGGKGPWADHARRRLESLAKQAGRTAARPR
jgi:tetratricopeptide (TPR) repeat protein